MYLARGIGLVVLVWPGGMEVQLRSAEGGGKVAA